MSQAPQVVALPATHQVWRVALCADNQTALLQAETAPVPVCPPGGAIVRLLAVGLCGSDVEKLCRSQPPVGEVLGHEVVGEIVATDSKNWPVGQRLVTSHHVPCGQCQACLNGAESMCVAFKATNLVPGGFAEFFALSAGHLAKTAILLPEKVMLPVATAVEPLACVLKALHRACLVKDCIQGQPTVVIIGLGYIGLLTALALRQQYGASLNLVGVEKSSARREQLQQLGLEAVFTTIVQSEEFTEKVSPPVGADHVFLTVATPEIAQSALHHVRDGGTLVLFSRSLGETAAHFSVNDLYYREIAVVPSYSPNLENLYHAAELLLDGKLNVLPLYTHQLPLTQLNEAVSLYQSGQAIKVWLTP